MTALLITVDTELSASLHQRGLSLEENLRRSIHAETGAGAYGIGWQMDLLQRHGLKGVFFLDPLPALVHGAEFPRPIVGQIVGRGHEVQLHIHTEWLAWARESPVEGRQGRNIGDFSLADQVALLGLARRLLEDAGAPAIRAFRAGNFGANDDTLRALAQIGGIDAAVPGDANLGKGAQRIVIGAEIACAKGADRRRACIFQQAPGKAEQRDLIRYCLLYTSPSPRDRG